MQRRCRRLNQRNARGDIKLVKPVDRALSTSNRCACLRARRPVHQKLRRDRTTVCQSVAGWHGLRALTALLPTSAPARQMVQAVPLSCSPLTRFRFLQLVVLLRITMTTFTAVAINIDLTTLDLALANEVASSRAIRSILRRPLKAHTAVTE